MEHKIFRKVGIGIFSLFLIRTEFKIFSLNISCSFNVYIYIKYINNIQFQRLPNSLQKLILDKKNALYYNIFVGDM